MCASSASTSRATASGNSAANAPRLRGGFSVNRASANANNAACAATGSLTAHAASRSRRIFRNGRLRFGLRVRLGARGRACSPAAAPPDRDRREPNERQRAAHPRPDVAFPQDRRLRHRGLGGGRRDRDVGARAHVQRCRRQLRNVPALRRDVPPRQADSVQHELARRLRDHGVAHAAPRQQAARRVISRASSGRSAYWRTPGLALQQHVGQLRFEQPHAFDDDRARARNPDGELAARLAPLLRQRHALGGQPSGARERGRRRHGRLHRKLEDVGAKALHAREPAIGDHHGLERHGADRQRAGLLRKHRVAALADGKVAPAARRLVLAVFAELLDDRFDTGRLRRGERRTPGADAHEQPQREQHLRLRVHDVGLCDQLHENVGGRGSVRIRRQHSHADGVRLPIADPHRRNRELACRLRHELELPLVDFGRARVHYADATATRRVQDIELCRERRDLGIAAHGTLGA